MSGKILWIGSYQSETLFEKMLATHIGQASSYAAQKGIIKGMDEVLPEDCVLDTLGAISYPAYPTYPKMRVRTEEWSRTGKSHDKLVGFLNIKYANYFLRQKALSRAIRNWGKKESDPQSNTVFVFEPGVTKLREALSLKEKYGAKVFVIIPDIPELVNLGANKIVHRMKNRNAKKMRDLFKKVDGFILYSAHMAEYYHIPAGKWMLMEGVFDTDESAPDVSNEEHDTVRLMYCGALDEFRGIPQLLDAFDSLTDRKYELWLAGSGRSDALIRERTAGDNRIHYFGYLPSREDVLELENKADILIHTRDINSPAAPYCFPSKVFEYLATGKLVLSVIIPGIPSEYFDYMIPIKEFSVEGIKNAIQQAVSITPEEQTEKGKKAREFILNNKNSRVQAGKILDFARIEQRGK